MYLGLGHNSNNLKSKIQVKSHSCALCAAAFELLLYQSKLSSSLCNLFVSSQDKEVNVFNWVTGNEHQQLYLDF